MFSRTLIIAILSLMTTFHIITIFPESFDSYVGASIIARAVKAGKIAVKFYNPRDFTSDKHRVVDDKSYGGGPGMVMKAEPVLKAVAKARGRKKKVKVAIFVPSAKQFTNLQAKSWADKHEHIILICGRYEGIDARVKKILRAEEVSIGPYVLTGGELPAMVVMDAVSRQVPGVLGKTESLEESRTASPEVYTRPEVLEYQKKKYRVPKVLLSGDHHQIDQWRFGRRNK